MMLLRRLMHRVTGRHTWRLVLVDDGHNPATVHLTCKPCRITRDVPGPQYRLDPCFCRNATCDRWQAYVARFIADYGVSPTLDDIAIDEQLHAAKQALIAEYGTASDPQPFLAAFARLELDLVSHASQERGGSR